MMTVDQTENNQINAGITDLFILLLSLALWSCSSDDPVDNSAEQPIEEAIDRQTIVLNAEDYKHEFIGGGVSIGLFLGHHYSMGEEAQDKAIQLMAKDLNMKYFQDYIQIYPSDDPAYFDRRANYVKSAKAYNPDLEFCLVGNKFPDDLMTELVVDGETLQVLNTDDPEIYDRLAQWFFLLFKGFHERGVTTEIFNVVNEPDLDRTFRKYHYGLNGNTKEAVARIFKYAVPKFIQMLNDPQVNTTQMPIPLIMGPSTISPNGCVEYLRFFKSEHPEAWEQIDIVAAHQYENGADASLFRLIRSEAEGKPVYQSETHALKGDALGGVDIDRPLKAALSLSNLFGTAVRNGVSSWFYFQNNYPNEFHPGGLMFIPWAASEPTAYKHYYAFKQLTSSQPASSSVISHFSPGHGDTEITTFRKRDQDTIYMNYSNYSSESKEVSVIVKNEAQEILQVDGFSLTITDDIHSGELVDEQSYTPAQDTLKFIASKYSVNTLKIRLKN